jgi:hypothetical protein
LIDRAAPTFRMTLGRTNLSELGVTNEQLGACAVRGRVLKIVGSRDCGHSSVGAAEWQASTAAPTPRMR